MLMNTYRTVNLKESTYQRLSKMGKFGQSFDDLIHQLLETGDV